MDIRLVVLLLILIPVIIAGGIAISGVGMNAALIVLLGAVTIYLGYNWYARRIDREIIQPDVKKATPAKMYNDGVDFVPTSRNVLYGYHFKSITAAGPITGVITATLIWGWLPAILWLIIGVTFIGWASDYSAIIVAIRNDGNSLSAMAYKLISPRTRQVFFVFIFFYLLLIAGAFIGILAGIMDPRADIPFGILALAAMGLLAGQMLYKWKMDLILVTAITVLLTVGAMLAGAIGADTKTGVDAAGKPASAVVFQGPINSAVQGLDNALNAGGALFTVVDPTGADTRGAATMVDASGKVVPMYKDATGAIKMLPSFVFWCLFLFAFSYLAAILPIWRYAQPVNYIGFWITGLTIVFGALGAVVGGILGIFGNTAALQTITFQVAPFKDWIVMSQAKNAAGVIVQAAPSIQPIWPMLFVTIACGAISGWHALIGSVGTSRQLEYETDALPVGGGGMFSENTVGLLSLVAVSIVGVGGFTTFGVGVGKLLNVLTFGGLPLAYGTALGLGAFVVIVLTVTQLVFRLMRVTLAEWVGESWALFKNAHVATLTSMILTMILVLSGTWIYLFQLFGASNQLMAALSLMIVALWLRKTGRNPAYVLYTMVFMYITTMAAILVTGYNLYANILSNPANAAQPVNLFGAVLMIAIAVVLFVAAALIGWDAWGAWQKMKVAPPKTAPAPAE